MFIQRKPDLKWYIAWKQMLSAQYVCFRGDVLLFNCFSLYTHLLAYLHSFIYIFLSIFWYITMSNYVYIKNNRPDMMCCWWMNVIGSALVWRHNSFPIFSWFSLRKWMGRHKSGPKHDSLMYMVWYNMGKLRFFHFIASAFRY